MLFCVWLLSVSKNFSRFSAKYQYFTPFNWTIFHCIATYTTFYLSFHKLMTICFHFLVVINNAAMNICKHMSSCGHMFLLLLSRCLVMECWMIYYIFKVTVKLFPKVTMPFYIHICSVWEFIIKIWFLGSSLAA